jgi:thioesterase domain-containing protein/acyl carrier protein
MDFVQSIAADFRTDTADGFVCRIPADVAMAVKAATASSPLVEAEKRPAAAEHSRRVAVPYQRISERFHDIEAIDAAIEALPLLFQQDDKSDLAVGPRNEREKQLAAIWCRVLKLPAVGIREDYFAIGGTSLLAVRLVLDIEKVFGRQLPIATLLKAPTIEKLAKFLDEPVDSDDLAMVTLRAEGSGPPLLLMPGIGGHVLKYKRLVDLLETDQPVYGFEMRPEISTNLVPRPLAKMANEFVARIVKVQPNGPYYLAGWSFGGMLAFEIAQQLIASGKVVHLVALFDTWNNGYPRSVHGKERFGLHVRRFANRTVAENLRYVAVTGAVTARIAWHRLLKITGVRKTDFYQYESPATEKLVAVCDAASKQYAPRPLPLRLSLLRAMMWPDLVGLSYEDPQNGWGGLAAAVDVYPVQADHLGLFDEPAVRETAAQLDKSIRAARKTDYSTVDVHGIGNNVKTNLPTASPLDASVLV